MIYIISTKKAFYVDSEVYEYYILMFKDKYYQTYLDNKQYENDIQ